MPNVIDILLDFHIMSLIKRYFHLKQNKTIYVNFKIVKIKLVWFKSNLIFDIRKKGILNISNFVKLNYSYKQRVFLKLLRNLFEH